jgi:hypothetical protein
VTKLVTLTVTVRVPDEVEDGALMRDVANILGRWGGYQLLQVTRDGTTELRYNNPVDEEGGWRQLWPPVE